MARAPAAASWAPRVASAAGSLTGSRGCETWRTRWQWPALCLVALLVSNVLPGGEAQPPSGGGGPEEGALRLADSESGDGYEVGRLEIFRGGRWGNICPTSRFTPDSAQVACRQLGFDGGARLEWWSSIRLNVVLGGTARILLSDVDCDGTESRLLDCDANTSSNQVCRNSGFSPRTDRRGVVLSCSNSVPSCDAPPEAEEEGNIRLRGGYGTPCDQLYTGFVEIFHNNEWGAITDTLESGLVSDVVCRQLGFPHGTGLDPIGATDAPPPPPPLLLGIYEYEDTYMRTDNTEEAEEPVGRVWLRSVSCTGPEARLIDCDLDKGFVQKFGAGERPGRLTVACRMFAVEAALEAVTTPGAVEGELRLFNQTTVDNWVQGRLEVFFEGTWAQVCGLAFDAADAQVACRQLGFAAGTSLSTFATEAPARNQLVFPEVAITKSGCNGSEARLVDCPVDTTLDSFIESLGGCYGVGPGLYVACVADPLAGEEEGAIRLRDEMRGAGQVSGVLEIFHAGAWGTVCDGGANFLEVVDDANDFGDYYYSGFNPSAGDVACQELGFSGGVLKAIARSDMDDISPPWADNLLCVGNENLLRECPGIVFGDTVGCKATQRLVCTA